jgi:hypothetical protein
MRNSSYLFFLNFSNNKGFKNYDYYCYYYWGHVVAQWLRHCAKNRKVAGSIPVVIGIFR